TNGAQPDTAELRNFLALRLPDYMIPAYFVELDTLPLTSSGKVDRKALPVPAQGTLSFGTLYVAPRNERERLLADIWEQVLRRSGIGVNDNFFHAGGDSIKAIQISSRMGAAGWQLAMKSLFAHPTIAGQASRMERKKRKYDQGLIMGDVPLTAVQQWFFDEYLVDQHHFNQAVMLEWSVEIDLDVLRVALNALLHQHDMLRAVYAPAANGLVQRIGADLQADLQLLLLPTGEAAQQRLLQKANEVQASFDLGAGPLFKAVVFRDEQGIDPDRLLLVIHHLVVDGISWRILMEDLETAYQQVSSGEKLKLTEKTASFQLWANTLSDYVAQQFPEQQIAYWKSVSEASSVLPGFLPDHPEAENRMSDTRALSFLLSEAETSALLHQVNQAYHTEINDLLLTALSRALHASCGAQAYSITLEGHGREQIVDLDISRTVGWFTSAFPFILSHHSDGGRHLQEVKEALRKVPNKGLGFGLLRYFAGIESMQGASQISFNYLGSFDQFGDNSDSLFGFSSAGTGDSSSARASRLHELEVSGVLIGGQLRISISYSDKRMETARMEALVAEYHTALRYLIEHCVSVENGRLSPADFSGCNMDMAEYDQFLAHHQIEASFIEDIYPLSPLQEGMLFEWMLHPDSPAYFTQLEINLGNRVDAVLLKNAWQQLIKRHAILRTAFFNEYTGAEQRPLQVVFKEMPISFEEIDLRSLNEQAQENAIAAYRAQDQKRGFELSALPLIRFALFQRSEERSTMLMSNHHIIMDGWSLGILFKEMLLLYTHGNTANLPAPILYSSHIRYLEAQNSDKASQFWQEYLHEYEPAALIPDLKVAGKLNVMIPREHLFHLSEVETTALSQLAARAQASLNTVLQGLWAVLLGRYNQRRDIVFGMTTSGRTAENEGTEDIVGLFINTIPVRIRWEEGWGFIELVQALQLNAQKAQEYAHYALVQIQALTGEKGGSDLFDHLMVFENYPIDETLTKGGADSGLLIESVRGYDPVHYDMNLTVSPGKKLGFKIGWNESAWPEAWVNIVEGHLRRLIGSILAAPNQQISTLEIVPEQERNIVLYDFNDTAAGYPKDKTIVQLFEEQAEKTPDQTALIFGETTFTYRELNEKANQLAHYLRNTHQIQANDVVALQIERSASTIIGILGVLKSGAAYLPISTDFPPARVRYMLANSRAKTLLTDEISHVSALEFKAELPDLSIERLDRILSKDLPAHNPERINAGPDLAYVLYTSGSTGQPKGVSMPQRSLVNLIQWQNANCNLGFGDRTAQFVPYTFDVSFQEIFATLSSGGTLIVLPQDIQQQFTELPHFIAKHRINRLFLPFVGLQQLAELVKDAPTQLSDLKEIITAGEQLQSSAAIRHLLASLPGCVLKNQYGPTEAHVVSEYVLGSYPAAWPDLPPIGKPIANVELHILDAHFQPTPIGIPGELLIGGIALADGYLNNADLTAEKFIAHPFKSGARLYKTGDLARWLPDGNIEYLGRIDQQLKIRGYRIETGEIEQVLLSHEGVQTCVVVGLEFSGVKELAAYLVPKPETSLPDATILRSFLGNTLPDYMIPSYFVALESMPMTSSGKVDRKALPAPDMAQLASGAAYVAPRNAIENQLVEIWQQVLGRDQIGVEDNFFNLGGHSLRAIRVVSLIRQALSVEIRLSEIFANPTIAALAERVIAESKVNFKTLESIPQLAPSADYALSNAQRRLWVLDQMSETAEAHAAYNMPAALRLRGDLDVVALEQVFELLFERHESLRTKFRDGRQVISPVAPYQLPQRDCQGMSAAAIDILVKTHALRAFDLANDSLLQLELLQLEADEYLLLFNMHHIISDGWSLDVLVREMTTLYEAIHQGVKEPLSALPALKIQYKDYAAWQNELLESESAEVMRTFWLNQLSKEDGMLPTLELPTDYARPTLKTYNGATIGTVLPAKVLDGLKTLCQTQGATLFMGLTALVKSLIYRYTGQEDILIGTPVAGRNHPDLHDQIGFYINTVVLRNRLQGDESFETLLNAVKTSTLAAFEHEAYPFDRLVEDLDLPRDLSRSTVFDVMLVLQNNERSELRFGDVALSVEGAETGISKFDLTFSFTETAEGLLMGLEYNTDLFKSDRIARMAEHLQTLLDSVLYDPKAAIGALNLLPAAEKQQLLYNFNDTSADYPKDKTIVQLFEKQVEKTPDQTAVVFEGRALSYRELNEQSNQLAHHLRGTYNIKPDDIVALQLGRSERMIIAIMGVLKSGAAYLPIALDYPEMRVTYMLKDSGAKVLLTDAVVHESALNLKADLPDLVIEPIEQAMAGSGETDNPACNNHGSSLAYVIYTSGSTGLPKGVMVEHHNFLNFAGHYPFEQHVCSLTCNYIFDVSVMEMLPALLASGTLVIPPLEVTLDLDAYAEFLYRNKITNTYLHASYLEGISARLAQYPEVYLKRLQIGVEPIRDHSIAWYKAQNIKILNWYGPTETTIFSTVYEVPNETPVTDEKLLIGQPIHNTAVLILDSSGALQPIGVSGELCIAGAGLARGYLNNPTLTAEKFVPHPFKVGERMYKTGDLARWLPDGDIEFLGRIDYQLKIRGYRIEAGEIEQALLKHEAIKSCLVTGYERDGVKELVAYLVPVKVGTVPDTTMLRRFLSATLPEYMIPGYYVELEAFPLTPSGKINRKALPTPDAGVLVVETSYTAPRNAVEGQLVEIWQQVLGREQIGVEDNFFNLGGHSLRAIRVVSLIRQAMSVEIRLSEIFANPTIAALAERVITESKDNLKTLQSIPQLAESADYALSNAQRRLWVIDQMSETAEAHAAYNMPATLRLRGDLDIAALERVFELLFERHESLRTRFREGRQVISPAVPYKLPQRNCRSLSAEAIDTLVKAHALRTFDLALDSLLQLELLQLEADAYLLLFNMHHIIFDGWSMEVLVREMTKLYEA
ncbi:MAG: amino acid adenylation domain-containing protein, partial [Bacteroidota bacterium]